MEPDTFKTETPSPGFFVSSSGYVGIGTEAPTEKLTILGSIFASAGNLSGSNLYLNHHLHLCFHSRLCFQKT